MKDIEFLKSNDIDVDGAIEILGDIDMYNETLKDFLDLSGERLKNIEKYKNEGNLEEYAVEVHAMKGDSKYLGFTKLAELALEHQLKSQDGDMAYVNDNYDDLINEANRVINICNEYFGN
ncbi:MAG: Hpt domain-containing protein [Bacilli bacterium]|nr:Hpt domain-containing protein [Bacilli bacterium]